MRPGDSVRVRALGTVTDGTLSHVVTRPDGGPCALVLGNEDGEGEALIIPWSQVEVVVRLDRRPPVEAAPESPARVYCRHCGGHIEQLPDGRWLDDCDVLPEKCVDNEGTDEEGNLGHEPPLAIAVEEEWLGCPPPQVLVPEVDDLVEITAGELAGRRGFITEVFEHQGNPALKVSVDPDGVEVALRPWHVNVLLAQVVALIQPETIEEETL